MALSKSIMFDPLFEGGLEEIANAFIGRAHEHDALQEASRSGCLIINTISDDDGSNQEITQKLNNFLNMIKDAFKTALKNERANATLIADLDIDQASEFLRGELVGLNIIIKVNGCVSAAAPAAQFAAQLVRSWKTNLKQ